MFFDKAFKMIAGAVVALGLSVPAASAVTLMNNGDVFNIGPGLETEFVGDVVAPGGAGEWFVEFNSSSSGSAQSMVTVGPLVASTFSDLTLSWVNLSDNSIVSVPITPTSTVLSTVFGPSSLSQALQVSFSDSQAGVGFDIEVTVAPIPLPFAGALLLTGLGGLVLLRRTRATV